MTWRQIAFVYFGPRDDKGKPVTDEGEPLDPKAMFFRHAYLNCVTDPEKQERLWQDRESRLASLGGHEGGGARR